MYARRETNKLSSSSTTASSHSSAATTASSGISSTIHRHEVHPERAKIRLVSSREALSSIHGAWVGKRRLVDVGWCVRGRAAAVHFRLTRSSLTACGSEALLTPVRHLLDSQRPDQPMPNTQERVERAAVERRRQQDEERRIQKSALEAREEAELTRAQEEAKRAEAVLAEAQVCQTSHRWLVAVSHAEHLRRLHWSVVRKEGSRRRGGALGLHPLPRRPLL